MGYGLHKSWGKMNQHEIYIAINGVHNEIIGESLFTPIFAHLAPTLKCSIFFSDYLLTHKSKSMSKDETFSRVQQS